MRLLKADYRFKRVYELTPEWIVKNNIEALVLDVDNTLTTHGSQRLDSRVAEWLDLMRRCGVKLVVLSNNRERRVKPFAEKIGVSYIANGMKPFTYGLKKAIAMLGSNAENIAMVGDQVFTDVLVGNVAGVKTVRLEPIRREKGKFMRLKRKLEKHVD